MTFIKRLRSLFASMPAIALPIAAPATSPFPDADSVLQLVNEPDSYNLTTLLPATESLPRWLTDEEALRDEGVLFGIADAQPDEKVAEIRAYFDPYTVPLAQLKDRYTDEIQTLDQLISQRENRLAIVRDQIRSLANWQPEPSDLIRTTVSLVLTVVMSVGNFYLIDETLQPAYPNRWIAIGVFLAGMFNLFGRTSFFYEEGTRLTGRRLVEETGLPLAASLFVLAQALKTQPVWQAGAIFVFVFFLFLLAGKLFLSTLTLLQKGISTIELNRQMVRDKQQTIPHWEAERERLEREINAIRVQKRPVVAAQNQVEADLTRLNARRDQLVNLFLSEYELARSLRNRLTEQQRELLMN
ncbi:hypothetical protein [Spirosoma agri]|uniref:Uncharacterized protein n=1 Tax=Spirosoma agri TaxID=1987381 RepID=A0A6M0IH90_9BACT|nr:hypothetical protein [Spirosoma agri]NEU67646.1 hypothetical protein [Spirosoma agri]